jgi:phosphoglycolate phosphatase
VRRRLAIFDFDGTLADTWPWFLGVLDDMAGRFKLRRVDAREAERLRGCGNREILRALEVRWWRLPAIARYLRRRAATDVEQIVLFPGAAEMLRDIAGAGVTVAIVSSNTEAAIRRVLGPELAAAVAIFECGASLFGKPSKFRDALRQSGVSRADAIAIGDEERDIAAAREVGIASGAVLWGYASAELLRRSGATYVFESFAALRDVLLADAPLLGYGIGVAGEAR